MPLYEYLCAGCAGRFEALARSWRDQATCPRCGSGDVARQLSTFAMSTGSGSAAAPALPRMAGGGGCCGGGGCGCH